ncbi:MAG: hypothetical protein H6621_11550 [Halobacteriovoraceae bacterium]|nr:hypothetical protein [Halobacteriovoraceae bacterium]
MKHLFPSKHELFPVFVASTTGFFVLTSYNWVRSASPALFMSFYSKDELPWAMGLMAIGLVIALYFYNKILSWFGPRLTFHICTITSTLLFVVHYFAISAKIKIAALSLFILKDIYVMILIEQIWSYFNTVNTVESSKKTSGFMMAIVTIGPIVGGQIISHYATTWGSEAIVLYSSFFILPSSLFLDLGLRRLPPQRIKSEIKREHRDYTMGLSYLKKYPVLLSLFFIILISQVLAATTTLRLQAAVSETILSVDQQTAYFGNYYSLINIVAAFMQFIGTPLCLQFIPLSIIHLVIPIIHIFLGIFVLFTHNLSLIMLASLSFKSIDYSLFRGAKELLYIPFNFDVRYRTKQIIDVFGYRSGKAGISLLLGVLKTGLRIPDVFYSYFSLIASVIWVFFAFKIARHLPDTKNEKSA